MSELNNSSLLIEEESIIRRDTFKESYFLGNKVEEKYPTFIGKIKVLMYSADSPLCSIGPDCKQAYNMFLRSSNHITYTTDNHYSGIGFHFRISKNSLSV